VQGSAGHCRSWNGLPFPLTTSLPHRVFRLVEIGPATYCRCRSGRRRIAVGDVVSEVRARCRTGRDRHVRCRADRTRHTHHPRRGIQQVHRRGRHPAPTQRLDIAGHRGQLGVDGCHGVALAVMAPDRIQPPSSLPPTERPPRSGYGPRGRTETTNSPASGGRDRAVSTYGWSGRGVDRVGLARSAVHRSRTNLTEGERKRDRPVHHRRCGRLAVK
jgi:hypothetical protein